MPQRRQYLGLLATGVTGAVTGCLDGGTEPGDRTTGEQGTDGGTATAPGGGEGTETATERDGGDARALSGEIRIAGSSTVYPISDAIVEDFRRQQPEVNFSLSRDGTGGGFRNLFCEGTAEFNNASRPITAAEEQLCAENGVEHHEIRVATDAVTVIVNADNDWVDCITTDELRQIWRDDGATTWADVRRGWPDREIERFGPADTSGTFDYFREAVLGDGVRHTSAYASTEQDNVILQGVQSAAGAIGYLGFAYYDSSPDAVTALPVAGGDGCVEPSLDAASDGRYPLARPLYTYINRDALAEAHVAEFARYLVERSADEELIADDIGYVPNSEATRDDELAALEAAIDDAQRDSEPTA